MLTQSLRTSCWNNVVRVFQHPQTCQLLWGLLFQPPFCPHDSCRPLVEQLGPEGCKTSNKQQYMSNMAIPSSFLLKPLYFERNSLEHSPVNFVVVYASSCKRNHFFLKMFCRAILEHQFLCATFRSSVPTQPLQILGEQDWLARKVLQEDSLTKACSQNKKILNRLISPNLHSSIQHWPNRGELPDRLATLVWLEAWHAIVLSVVYCSEKAAFDLPDAPTWPLMIYNGCIRATYPAAASELLGAGVLGLKSLCCCYVFRYQVHQTDVNSARARKTNWKSIEKPQMSNGTRKHKKARMSKK